MSPFELSSALGIEAVEPAHFVAILVRLCVAAALGALVAYRPWRRLFPRVATPRVESAQAQTLIAVAGAIMVVVIGDSMARAFGLVGLGAFIRFRSGIKDPRDAAVMFVMIGIGMACGLGLVPLAGVATLFATAVLLVFDATGRARPRRMKVGIDLEAPHPTLAAVRAALPGGRVLEAPSTALPERGRVVLEIDADDHVDAAALLELLRAHGVDGVRTVTISED